MATEMKSLEEIQDVLEKLPPTDKTNFPAMTYEAGVEETLLWVLGHIEDDEFSPCM